MGSCAAPSAKGDDKFITTDYLQQCHADYDVRLVQDCCYDPDRDAHEALLRSGFGGRVQVV
ncbi:hypothetical protein [Escherichia coli]|uniref:hypothetical protein n=1 Tax=Escherichia coli TaxID=562 RepID=UPI00307A1B87